jgi:hypothetical protein
MITAIGLQRRSTDLTSRRSSTSSDDARQIHRLTVKTSPQQRRRTGSAINLSSCHAPLDLIFDHLAGPAAIKSLHITIVMQRFISEISS